MRRVIRQIVSPMPDEPTCPPDAWRTMAGQRYKSRSLKKVVARCPLRSAQPGTPTLSPSQIEQLFDQHVQQAVQIRRGVQLLAHPKEGP